MAIENIDNEVCTGCGACVDACMMDVIRIDPQIEKAVIKYQKDCFACRNCQLDCPNDAITITYQKGTLGVLPWG